MAANVNADAFIPSLWDSNVIRVLEDNTFLDKIARLKPTKPARGYGDTVYFNALADPVPAAYSGTVTYSTLVSSQVALLIDQQSYIAFDVTDIEQAMANVDLKGSQSARMAYAFAKAIDVYAFGGATSPIVADAGTTATADSTCDATTVLSDIAVLGRILEEQNVNDGDKWLLVPPWIKEHLLLAGVKFSINEGTNGTGGMSWAQYLGFDIYVTNNLYNSGTAAAPVTTVLAGSYNSIAYEKVISETRAMPREAAFAVGVSSLVVYGVKVVKPMEIVKMICTYTANTTI